MNVITIILIIVIAALIYIFTNPPVHKRGGVEPSDCAYCTVINNVPTFHYLGDSKPNSVYNIGSISKSLTAYLCVILSDKSLLDLDTPIAKYDLDLNPKIDKTITIKQLLNHTSGLSQFESGINGFVEEPPSLNDILYGIRMTEAGKHQFPDIDASKHNNVIVQEHPPGTHWQYNGANYVILQMVLEKKFGTPLEDIMREHLLNPLKMENTTMQFSAIRDKILTPHWKDGSVIKHYLFAEGAAAGIYSTIEDISKFVLELLNSKLLSAEGRKLLYDDPLDAKYGLGFKINGKALYNTGTNWGWKAYIYAGDQGFAMLSNYQYDYQDWIQEQILQKIKM